MSGPKSPKLAGQPMGNAQQAGALMKNAQAFAGAFEKGDGKAVVAFWAEDGDYVDLNGRYLHGRPSIENAFKDFFAENKGLEAAHRRQFGAFCHAGHGY
jgi:ketosteroid isomerase-like protein